MSTIGGLLMPSFAPADLGQAMNRGIAGATGILQGQTSLLTLADLKAKQQAEQEYLLAVKNDPALREQLFGPGGGGMGTIASLPTTASAPPGPITQSPLGGGPAQTIPAPPDASRFANVPPTGGGPIPPNVMGQVMPTVTAPQGPPGVPTLATLGPQGGMPGAPQGAMQGPQNPVLEMARTNPRAAMMMQQQIEGRQEAAMKRQEQNLKLGAATLGYVGQQAQGVTDQAGLDALRSDLQSQGLGKYAAQLPQLYSKDAMQPFIAKALDVEKTLTLQIQELEARTKAGTLGLAREKAAQTIPNYTGDAQLDALIYTRMKDQPPGTMPSREIVDDAIKQREADKLRVSREQGAAQEQLKPLGETATLRFNTLTQAEDTIKKLTTEFTPAERAKFVGMGGMTMGAEQLKQLAADAGYGKADPKFARFAALVALAKAEAFSTAGKALTETESGVVYGYIPTGKEYSAEEFEQKLTLAQERVPSMLDRELKLATTPRSELPGMRQRGELGASTAGRTGGSGQGGNTFTDADIVATLANPANKGKTRQQVIDAALAKGLTYKER